MRDEKEPYANYYDMIDNAKIIGTLVNVNYRSIEHILRLNYLASLHKLSNIVLDADSKVKEVKIEIPYYGVLILKIEDNKIIESSFKCEDYLVSDINKIITTGESPMISEAKKKVGDRISKRYQGRS